MNLVEMQFWMLERMKDEMPKRLSPMVGMFDTNDVLRGFRRTTLTIRECGQNQGNDLYMVEFAVAKERGDYVVFAPLFSGSWEDMKLFIGKKLMVGADKWDFFSLCKAYSLWFDWQMKNGVFDSMSDGLKGRAKFLGWGNTEGARGVFVSIAKGLLDGCRLIVRADICVAYAESNDINHAAENFGVGLRLVEVHATSEFSIEATFEPIRGAVPQFIHVNRGRQMTPRNAYVLATDFNEDFIFFQKRPSFEKI